MVLAMAVTILAITTWAAPSNPESDSVAPIPPISPSGGPRSLRTADGRGRAACSGRRPDGQDGTLPTWPRLRTSPCSAILCVSQLGVAAQPHLLEGLFGPSLHTESVHGNEHHTSPGPGQNVAVIGGVAASHRGPQCVGPRLPCALLTACRDRQDLLRNWARFSKSRGSPPICARKSAPRGPSMLRSALNQQ
jgi:hypothetical protein